MRVTKNIREYIEKEVKARLEPKYAAEIEQAEREVSRRDAFIDGLNDAVEIAYNQYFTDHYAEIADFCDDDRTDVTPPYASYRAITIRDYCCINSPHKWRSRMNTEVEEKVANIIVHLELGGTKAELDEMLSKI